MSFWLQPTRPFEFTSPVIDQIIWPFLSVKPISTIVFSHSRLRSHFSRRIINERIVEIPFILFNLPPKPSKILDVGANESPISLMLASLNHSVVALDLRPYPFFHPNLVPIIADITLPFTVSGPFDVVICLSVLEHIGLPVYGGRSIRDGDKLAIHNMFRLLRPGGRLFLTTPIAHKPALTPAWRVYDLVTLKKLFSQFSKVDIQVGYKNSLQNWQISSSLPKSFISFGDTPSAVALINAVK